MTDLRDQLADTRLPRTGLGAFLRQLRHDAGLTLNQVAAGCHVTRKAISNREIYGVSLPTEALVDHAQALGYRVVLQPIKPPRSTGTGWPDAGALTPDRRTA